MKRGFILATMLFLFCGIFVIGWHFPAANAAGPATYRMDLQAWPPGGPYLEQIKMFAHRVETYSGGRIKVNVLAGGTVAPSTKEFDALETGALKWAATCFNFNLGRLGKVGGIFGANPAGPTAVELFAWYRYGGAHKYIAEMLKRAKSNVLVIGGPLHLTGAESFGWFKKPITKLSDFKGMKYRCMGLYGEIAKKLGAAVVNLPGGEIYQAYERGVIDGFEYCTPAMDYAAGFHNLKAVMMEPGFQSTTAMASLMVRKDTWEQLPDEFKKIIEAASWGSMEDYAWMMIEDAKAMIKFKEAGVKIYTLPKEVQMEIVKAADELYAQLAKEDPLFKAVYEEQSSFLEKWRSVDYVCQPRYEYKYPFSRQ
jgi:TRAP-type mannitol/chloroaromatic compound transport system substrate-binding protein